MKRFIAILGLCLLFASSLLSQDKSKKADLPVSEKKDLIAVVGSTKAFESGMLNGATYHIIYKDYTGYYPPWKTEQERLKLYRPIPTDPQRKLMWYKAHHPKGGSLIYFTAIERPKSLPKSVGTRIILGVYRGHPQLVGTAIVWTYGLSPKETTEKLGKELNTNPYKNTIRDVDGPFKVKGIAPPRLPRKN